MTETSKPHNEQSVAGSIPAMPGDSRPVAGSSEGGSSPPSPGASSQHSERPADVIREWFTAGSKKRWRTSCWHRAPDQVIAALDSLEEQLEAYERIRQVADDPELSDDFVGNTARRLLSALKESKP